MLLRQQANNTRVPCTYSAKPTFTWIPFTTKYHYWAWRKTFDNHKQKWQVGKNNPGEQIVSGNVLGLHRGKNNLYSHPKCGSIFLATELYTNELPAWRTMRKTHKFMRETLNKPWPCEEWEKILSKPPIRKYLLRFHLATPKNRFFQLHIHSTTQKRLSSHE